MVALAGELLLGACSPPGDQTAVATGASAPTTAVSATVQPATTSLPTKFAEPEAWAAIRRAVPAGHPVLRPEWLPPALKDAQPTLEYAYATPDDPGGYRYRIGYAAAGKLVMLAAGAVNSAPPVTREALTVRGVAAQFSTTDSWPPQQITWIESGNLYSIQASGVSRDELLHVAASLFAVP